MSTTTETDQVWHVDETIEVATAQGWKRGTVEDVFGGVLTGKWVYVVDGTGYYLEETRA